MTRRRKIFALFTFLSLIGVLFIQGYINFTVKLPTQDHYPSSYNTTSDTTKLSVISSGAEQEVEDKSERGFYTVIESKPRQNRSVFVTGRKIYHLNDSVQYSTFKSNRGAIFNIDRLNEKSSLSNDIYHDPKDLTSYSDVTDANVHEHRITSLRNTCDKATTYRRHEQRKGNLSEFYYSREHKFAYCKVPKSGSTFWMKVFMILSKGHDFSETITHMSRSEIHSRTRFFIIDPGRILRNGIPTIITSRNPFTRLFSAYIDKVYVPLFWNQFADMENVTRLPPYEITSTIDVLKSSNQPISSRLAKYRDSLRERGMLIKKNITQKIAPICANNASFEDFLRFIISEVKSAQVLEPHWAPISHLCHPCRFNIFKVIKQESFSRDVEHTLNSVGVNISRFDWLKKSLNENRASNSVPGIVAVVREKYRLRSVRNCINQTEILKRLWKSFQIQGFISKEIQFPNKLSHVNWNKYSNKVTDVVLDAISQKPMTSAEQMEQRDFFLRQAYKGISADVISEIQDIYYLDFLLFGYPLDPP